MQEGVSPLCPLKVRRVYRKERQQRSEAEAIANVVRRIEDAQAEAAKHTRGKS
jgi:hypothetical protein